MKLSRKVLLNQARDVDFSYPWKNQRMAEEMLALMRRNSGIGLAAPQCGISRRILVMQIHDWTRQCFNPEILDCAADLVDMPEGCLSFPGDQCIILRPTWVHARYQDHEGQWHSETLHGLQARCYQHELDHLAGITMWQRHKEQNAKQS